MKLAQHDLPIISWGQGKAWLNIGSTAKQSWGDFFYGMICELPFINIRGWNICYYCTCTAAASMYSCNISTYYVTLYHNMYLCEMEEFFFSCINWILQHKYVCTYIPYKSNSKKDPKRIFWYTEILILSLIFYLSYVLLFEKSSNTTYDVWNWLG